MTTKYEYESDADNNFVLHCCITCARSKQIFKTGERNNSKHTKCHTFKHQLKPQTT